MGKQLLQTALVWAVVYISLPVAQSLPKLRIMPLGDSITKGSGSSDQAGYRSRLRSKLTNNGFDVDMIGTLHSPSGMKDNDHEGHSGEFLMEIKEYWKSSIVARPNVVCIHAGTNNMDKGRDLDIAPALIEEIIDGIFTRAPDVTILIAPVIWANNEAMNRNTDAFNAKLMSIISKKQSAGKHILPVQITIGKSDLSDTKHPNDAGYEKMAAAWYNNILEANKRGWLKNPVEVDPFKVGDVGLGEGNDASAGCAGGNWNKKLGYFSSSSKGSTLRFADLTGNKKADIISVDGNGKARAWLNKGDGKWDDIGEIAPGLDDVSSARIEFHDVNGDGLADYLVIYAGGAVKAYLNNGNIPNQGKDRIWKPAITISPGVGSPGRQVHFADLNGDGYSDYLIIYDGGAVDAFLNQKNIPSDGGRIWGDRSTVATGVGQPGSKVRFADITGDKKADYIIQYDGGAAEAYYNTGNIPKVGTDRVWGKMGAIAGGVSDQGPVVYADVDGDGKADYLVVHDSGKVDAYLNICNWNLGSA